MKLDDLDRQILAYLQEDGRISFVTLASRIRCIEGYTIRKRIRKLEDKDCRIQLGLLIP